ncbi:ESF1 homolog [Solea solea]|uniref:ESF1 homolog n=1 Tax=Solea solea TaxID=90069 RepID=UPI00272D35FC|nr:ESF1 homolog [Solea solea]
MSSQKKKPRGGDGGGDDQRFLRVQKDPRFWEMPERERKVKIDKRFQSMFHDKSFKVTYTVDKRGRPINHTSTDNLRRFYKLSDSEDNSEDEEKEVKKKKKKEEEVVKDEKKEKTAESSDEDSDDELKQTEEEDDDDDEEEEESETGSGSEREDGESELDSEEDSDSDSGPDLARGKGNVDTSSDEDDDDDDVSALLRKEEEEIQHDWGELCKDAQRGEEVSARLAVCNMDWDRMKARDLLALCNSFSPKGGAVLSVKIYPSEFGKERLKTEETRGPVELKVLPEDSEEDTEEDKTYREKKRDYQFKRLKYFYAVVECDSVVTATKIYEECDGYEYESSCSVLDLRFIPDDVTFTDEPTDVATDVNLSTYTPKLFTSSATATSKVELTWDETDHERVTALNRKFNKDELLQMDFKAYLASSSEEEEDEEQVTRDQEEAGQRQEGVSMETRDEEDEEEEEKKTKSEEQMFKYRELLRGIHDKEKQQQQDKDMEMEITWVPGLKETTEQLVKKKLEGRDQLTPWEGFLEKKKERRKQKKTKRTKEAADDDLSDDELPVGVDLSDPFFADELRDTDVKKKQKKEKKTTKKKEEEPTAEQEELEKRKAEMSLLMDDDDADEHKHFNYDKIVERQNLSKKKKKKLLKKGEEPLEDDAFQVDVADPRFQAMFSSHLFNLDPSHPSYKKTKATQSIEVEKQRRRGEQQRRREDGLATQTATPTRTAEAEAEQGRDSVTVATKRAMEPSLSLLIKSIKNKTQQFQDRKKPKLS